VNFEKWEKQMPRGCGEITAGLRWEGQWGESRGDGALKSGRGNRRRGVGSSIVGEGGRLAKSNLDLRKVKAKIPALGATPSPGEGGG